MKQKIFRRIIEKKNSGKGFTLVELIIVLVILAILAALLIPTLTGYIDRANKMRVESACRMAVMGVKGEVSMLYGRAPAGGDLTSYPTSGSPAAVRGTWHPVVNNIVNLAEIDAENTYTEAYFTPTAEVKKVVYKTATYTCTYDGSGFTVVAETNALSEVGVALYFDGQTTAFYSQGDGFDS